MTKTNTIKKIFLFIVAMVMMTSPVLYAGCSWFQNISPDSNPIVPSNQGGGSGSGGGSSGEQQNPTSSVYDPPESNAIDLEDFDDYFQNYRLTYVPGEDTESSSFRNSIKNQNQEISVIVTEQLFKKYGFGEYIDSKNQQKYAEEMFNSAINYVESNNNYLVYSYFEDNTPKYCVVKKNFGVDEFTHSNAINNDKDADNENISWNWNGESTQFLSQANKNKFQLAEYLILSGEVLNEDGTGSFVDAYKQYFTDSTLTTIKQEYLTGENPNKTLNFESITDIILKIDHLGFTENEQNSLKYYVLNYIIGTNLVSIDNNRFVNAYSVNGEDWEIYDGYSNNSNIQKRFLTDECYATGQVENDFLDFLNIETDRSLEGICYYSDKYLKLASQTNFGDFDVIGYTSSTGIAIVNLTSNVDVTDSVYNNLINAYGSKIELDANNNPVKKFNANVWNYDLNNDGVADDTVQITINNNSYALVSIRLPYFKNYYNTVSSIISNIFSSLTVEQKAELDAQWQANKNMDYPYDSLFPNIPYSYFADYDNLDILFNQSSGQIDMFSGYMAYQTFVIMPKQSIYIKEAVIFFIRELVENEQDGSGDFEINVYARYYDSETQTYATWGDEDSEFYFVDTVNVIYDPDVDKNTQTSVCTPIPLQIDVKNILSTAKINGSERGNYLVGPMAENSEILLHEENLITAENYGWWFNTTETPEGDKVVCFDGIKTNSESYLEFVFANSDNRNFQFCFYPYSCYKV